MRMKWPLKILWLLGLIGLAYGSHSLEKFFSQNAEETFTVMSLIWFNNLMPFLFGLYISLITIKTWNYKFNKSLFYLVAVPCLIIALIFPLTTTLGINISDFIFKLFEINIFGIFSLVAGLSMIKSFFYDCE